MARKEKSQQNSESDDSDTIYYVFEPKKTLTMEEVTLLLQKIVGNWRMTQEQYNDLPNDLKDVFVGKKDGGL